MNSKFRAVIIIPFESLVPLLLPNHLLPITLRLFVFYASKKMILVLQFTGGNSVKQDCMPIPFWSLWKMRVELNSMPLRLNPSLKLHSIFVLHLKRINVPSSCFHFSLFLLLIQQPSLLWFRLNIPLRFELHYFLLFLPFRQLNALLCYLRLTW